MVFVERLHGHSSSKSRKGRGNDRISGVENPPLFSDDGTLNGGTGAEEVLFRETWLKLDDFRNGANGANGANGGADGEIEIEELIIRELVDRHTDWIGGYKR